MRPGVRGRWFGHASSHALTKIASSPNEPLATRPGTRVEDEAGAQHDGQSEQDAAVSHGAPTIPDVWPIPLGTGAGGHGTHASAIALQAPELLHNTLGLPNELSCRHGRSN